VLSGRAARCPDSGFKPLRRRDAWRPRGPSAVRDVPLVSDFRIKILPQRKLAQIKYLVLRKILEKFMEVGN
jgi:hypothetical protein